MSQGLGRGKVLYIRFSYILIFVQRKLVNIQFDPGGHFICHVELIPLTYVLKSKHVSSSLITCNRGQIKNMVSTFQN